MEHCDVNFQGGSSNKERVAVLKMFKRPAEFTLQYEFLVGDGDSKAFLDVWDCYGVCSHCERIRHILTKRVGDEFERWRASNDYNEWQNTHIDLASTCNSVKKLDCVQHVGKCFRDKLEALVKNSTANKILPADGKSINRGSHRLVLTLEYSYRNILVRLCVNMYDPVFLKKQSCRKHATTCVLVSWLRSTTH